MIEEGAPIDRVLSISSETSCISLESYLNSLIENYGVSKHTIIEKLNVSRSYGYQIFSGVRKPNRNTLIKIALVIGLDVEQTQRLLKIAQKGELYAKVRRDFAILYAIRNKFTVFDTEELLESIGEDILSIERDD